MKCYVIVTTSVYIDYFISQTFLLRLLKALKCVASIMCFGSGSAFSHDPDPDTKNTENCIFTSEAVSFVHCVRQSVDPSFRREHLVHCVQLNKKVQSTLYIQNVC